MSIELKRVYIRHKENYPESEVEYYAQRGFQMFGCETLPFYGFGDIQEIKDLGPEVGLVGYVGDIKEALSTVGKQVPDNIDYPVELNGYLGRDILITSLEEIRKRPGKQVFIKPVQHKLFSGFVWNGDESSRTRIASCHDNTRIYCSQVLDIVAEYRCFVLDEEILDVRLYKGDWKYHPGRDTIEYAVADLVSPNRAYCIDFGVLRNGKNIFIEMNEGYSFGHYGLKPELVARMLSARWNEMLLK